MTSLIPLQSMQFPLVESSKDLKYGQIVSFGTFMVHRSRARYNPAVVLRNFQERLRLITSKDGNAIDRIIELEHKAIEIPKPNHLLVWQLNVNPYNASDREYREISSLWERQIQKQASRMTYSSTVL